MKKMDSRMIDVVLTSPPYNTGNSVGKNDPDKDGLTYEKRFDRYRYDTFKENMTDDEYYDFTIDIFNGFDKVLKDNGVVLYNMSYGNVKPMLMYRTLLSIDERTPFTIGDVIVWKKGCCFPITAGNKLSRICEFVFVFCRKNEYGTYFINKEVRSHRENGMAVYAPILNFISARNNDGMTDLNHATFSSELVCKLLNIYALRGGQIYDPFMGTGTTAVGCIKMKMNFIGSEISQAQCDYAERRIAEARLADYPVLF